MHLRASEITLSKLLKGAGYATCHSGKWQLNGLFNNPAQPQRFGALREQLVKHNAAVDADGPD